MTGRRRGFWWMLAGIVIAVAVGFCAWFARDLFLAPRVLKPGEGYPARCSTNSPTDPVGRSGRWPAPSSCATPSRSTTSSMSNRTIVPPSAVSNYCPPPVMCGRTRRITIRCATGSAGWTVTRSHPASRWWPVSRCPSSWSTRQSGLEYGHLWAVPGHLAGPVRCLSGSPASAAAAPGSRRRRRSRSWTCPGRSSHCPAR